MIGKSTGSNGFPVHAGILMHCWRYVLAALLLAFNFGSARPAHAAPVALEKEYARFYLTVNNPKTTLCIGESHSYTLQVISQYPSFGGSGDWRGSGYTKPQPVAGVKVEAYPDPRSLGTFSSSFKTPKSGNVFTVTDGVPGDAPMSAELTFHASKKPGTGNLIFEGLVDGYEATVGYVSVPPLAIKVIPCQFKVKTIIRHSDAAFRIMMTTGQALITGNEGGTFTGSATLHYAYSTFGTLCGNVTAKATNSPVALTGQLDASGRQLTVTETFEPTTITGGNAGCGGAGSKTHQFTLDPLQFQVASSGGMVTATVAVGTARIVVIPQVQK